MATGDLLTRVQTRLANDSDDYSDEYLSEVIQYVSDRVSMRIGALSQPIPSLAESIVVDASVKVVRRMYYEGIKSEAAGDGGSVNTSFVDDVLAEYKTELDNLADEYDETGSSKRVVRFL